MSFTVLEKSTLIVSKICWSVETFVYVVLENVLELPSHSINFNVFGKCQRIR